MRFSSLVLYPSSLMLLALDTSTHTSSIALFNEHGVLGEVTWQSHENHTRSLMPEIVRLMELIGTNTGALRAIGVATGPGSFTGLRIGLSAAKGLAYSLNAALVGVPSLDVAASAFADQPLPVCAVLLAGRGRYGAALYENQDGSARRVTDYVFGAADALVELLQQDFGKYGSVLVTGELEMGIRQAFQNVKQPTVLVAHDGVNARRAGVLAALAWQRWQNGETDDIQALAPYYIPTASLA